MDKLPTHDSFVRRMLDDIDIAREYLKTYLPPEVSEKLDFSQLQPLPGTYLSDRLKKHITDRIFSCRTKDGYSRINISILFEHKSYKDKYTPIQVGGYLYAAYQKQVDSKEPLTLVIPIILYHGKEKWEKQTLAGLFTGIPDDLKQFLPDFDFVFNNLGKLSDEDIGMSDNNQLMASLLALKHIWDVNWLRANLAQLLNLTSAEKSGLQKAIIFYIFSRNKFDENILNSLPESIKSDVMNTFDVYYEKGIEKGREEGIEKGIEKGREEGIEKGKVEGLQEGLEKGKELIVSNLINSGKFAIPEIANFAGVPEAFVRKIEDSIKKRK